MGYELLVLDLDGTLVNTDKKISAVNKAAVMKLQESGKKVVLASGRPTPGVAPLAKELELEKYGSYILSFNGARITNCQSQEVIYDKCVDPKYLPSIYDMVSAYDVGLITFKDHTIYSAFEANPYVMIESTVNKLDIYVCENFVTEVDFPMNKILIPGEPSLLEKLEVELKEKFGGELSIFRSEPYFLEVMAQNIDKAYSLGKLLEILGLRKEQMVCCGDGFNDLTMIEFAGLGVAMENAQQVVLDAADFVTLSNDHDGVAHVIEKFML